MTQTLEKPVIKIGKALAKKIYKEAHQAGLSAGESCKPTPMVVGTPTTPLGSDIDFTKKTYVVPSGVCGFAWVNISPARGAFVNYLKSINAGHKGYYGGYEVWVSGFGQSYEQKIAYAHAFAGVCQAYGINAYGSGRLD